MGDEVAPFGRENAFRGNVNKQVVRTFEEDMKFIKKLTPWKYEVRYLGNHRNLSTATIISTMYVK
jgi:hypothetical protein